MSQRVHCGFIDGWAVCRLCKGYVKGEFLTAPCFLTVSMTRAVFPFPERLRA